MVFQNKHKIFGIAEEVVFPEFDNFKVIAKVDTGAWSGALHAEKITKRHESLYFEIENKKYSTKKFYEKKITSATGHAEIRYVIPVIMKIHGKKYKAEISLRDRKYMKFEMLLGRRFLLKNNILVDVKRNSEYIAEVVR